MSRWLRTAEEGSKDFNGNTIAENLLNDFNEIPNDVEEGFETFKDFVQVKNWRNKAEQIAIDVKDAVKDSKSYDESIIYTFKDGSKLQLDNPKQEAFSANVKIVE